MGLRERKNVDLIACPSCGRAEIDVIEVARQAQEAFGDREIPLQVAVMGCVVNGPGEARDADLGIAAGNKKGHLFVRGQNVAVVPEDEMVDALVEWATFIDDHGVDAAFERARSTRGAGPPRGRARPGGAGRRPGRRRQPERAAGEAHPQAEAARRLMARQVRRSEGWLGRVGVVLLAVLIVWLLVSSVLGFVFSLIRMLLFVALFAIVAWFVLIGPPGRHD